MTDSSSPQAVPKTPPAKRPRPKRYCLMCGALLRDTPQHIKTCSGKCRVALYRWRIRQQVLEERFRDGDTEVRRNPETGEWEDTAENTGARRSMYA